MPATIARVLDGEPESAADVVLTAAWDASSVADHLNNTVLIHLDRADSTAAVTGAGFTITLPPG